MNHPAVTTTRPAAPAPEDSESVSPAKRVRLQDEAVASAAAAASAARPAAQQLPAYDQQIHAGYRFSSSPTEKKLGEGGFSKVRRATHKLTQLPVAVKIMDRKGLGEDVSRIETEIHAMKSLRGHPSICSLFQVVDDGLMTHLVLELIEGGDLFEHIVSRQRLPESEAAVIIMQMLSVLQVMHVKGFAHRDLKPENVMLVKSPAGTSPKSSGGCRCSAPLIKLIDFGLCADESTAKLRDGRRTTIRQLETCCGSPAYAAPELLCISDSSGSSAVTTYSGPLIDVWSLGVMSYALIVGRLPFDHEHLNQLYRQIREGLKPGTHFPVWMSPESRSFLSSCLQVDPKKRSPVTHLLRHPLVLKYLPLITSCRSGDCRFAHLSATFSSGSSGKETNGRQTADTKSPEPRIGIVVQNLDEEIVFRMKTNFFPDLSVKEIANHIRSNGLDYVSSTYFLLKDQKSKQLIMDVRKENERQGTPVTTTTAPGTPTRRQTIVGCRVLESRKRKAVDVQTPPSVARRPVVGSKFVTPSTDSTTRYNNRTPLSPRNSVTPSSVPFRRKIILSTSKHQTPASTPAPKTPLSSVRTPAAAGSKTPSTPTTKTPAAVVKTPKNNIFRKIMNSLSSKKVRPASLSLKGKDEEKKTLLSTSVRKTAVARTKTTF